MNANRTLGLRLGLFALALGVFVPGLARAESGVATRVEGGGPSVVYTWNGSTEDPDPINPAMRKFGASFMIVVNQWSLDFLGHGIGFRTAPGAGTTPSMSRTMYSGAPARSSSAVTRTVPAPLR